MCLTSLCHIEYLFIFHFPFTVLRIPLLVLRSVNTQYQVLLLHFFRERHYNKQRCTGKQITSDGDYLLLYLVSTPVQRSFVQWCLTRSIKARQYRRRNEILIFTLNTTTKHRIDYRTSKNSNFQAE